MMKNLTKVNQAATPVHLALLIARLVIAALMLSHGLPKMMQLFSGEPVQFLSIMGMSPTLSLGLAVFAEVICSVLVLVGFATRLAVIPLIITMLMAVFYVHLDDPFTRKELGIQYLLTYLVLFFAGSGKYSVDQLLQSGYERPEMSGLIARGSANDYR
ncbi:MAG: DoxX family protein [Flavisolibacter sp.]